MATLATIESNQDGSITIRPATSADIDAVVAPSMTAEITASEQRTWQRMVDADAGTATMVETSLFGKIKAALQAALDYLGG